MSVLTRPFLSLIRRTLTLRIGTTTCVMLALVAAGAEIGVALSFVPILTSLGVDAGGEFDAFLRQLPALAWLLLFALAAGLRTLANWLSTVKTEQGTQELVVSLQARLYRALAAAHWDTVRRISPPTITSALQTQSYDAAYGFTSLVHTIAALLLIAGYLVAAALVFPLLLPALLAILGLMWWLNRRRSERVLVLSEDYVGATTGLHQRYEDWVAISRMASLGVDSAGLSDRFEAGAREASSHAVGYSRSSAATRVSYDLALVAAILVGVPVAWWLETPPALLAFGLVALVRVLPRAAGIQSGYQGIVSAVAPLQAVESLAEQLEADPVEHDVASEPLAWRRLELAGVGIEEPLNDTRRRWIMEEASLELRHGQWLAVTGPTGAGKTTLAEVLLMLLRPDSGELRIDGRRVDEKLANQWRNQAAYVPQEVVLFDATIRDNLRLYAPEASDARLKEALQSAAGDFVFERLPDGLDTRTGPGGRWLSGGERQRIGIARALLKEPGFLVLDEPTAALDADTQDKLMDALSSLEHTMSVVLITHRPELLRLADRIIGIEDGQITRRDDGFRRSDPDPRRP
jgi:ATP-binding cassette subfamily C protein